MAAMPVFVAAEEGVKELPPCWEGGLGKSPVPEIPSSLGLPDSVKEATAAAAEVSADTALRPTEDRSRGSFFLVGVCSLALALLPTPSEVEDEPLLCDVSVSLRGPLDDVLALLKPLLLALEILREVLAGPACRLPALGEGSRVMLRQLLVVYESSWSSS